MIIKYITFQVNDYVKNYIGDGKGPKNFAKEYVERRSKWRNALKSKKRFEDDLLTPAAAINPNIDDEVISFFSSRILKKRHSNSFVHLDPKRGAYCWPFGLLDPAR